jgi:hypothetical protein
VRGLWAWGAKMIASKSTIMDSGKVFKVRAPLDSFPYPFF